MSQKLPVDSFKWVKNMSQFNEGFIKSYNEDGDEGYAPEGDVGYIKRLEEFHDYLLNLSRIGYLMPPHPLINFEIQKCFQKEPRLNGVYSRNNLPKMKDGAYIINLDKYKPIRSHWTALFVKGVKVTYFHSFRVEHIPKDIKKFIGTKTK